MNDVLLINLKLWLRQLEKSYSAELNKSSLVVALIEAP